MQPHPAEVVTEAGFHECPRGGVQKATPGGGKILAQVREGLGHSLVSLPTERARRVFWRFPHYLTGHALGFLLEGVVRLADPELRLHDR